MTLSLVMIGTGYVGLVSGACLAALGHNVLCIDVDPKKIETLNNGGCPLFEDGLPELLTKVRGSGHLRFSTQLPESLESVDAVFLGVGTPQNDEGRADMNYINAAFESLLPRLGEKTVVVTKSTVPVGTCSRLANWMKKERPDLEGHLASNPEFLREGTAVDDFMHPDRVVTGARTQHAHDTMTAIYKPLTDKGVAHLQTDPQSSEIIKYAANAFLATKIGFINEMAALCENVGGNVGAVAEGMGLDTRIGHRFLRAGPGYGGSCFPKDTSALKHIAKDAGTVANVTESAITANINAQQRMVDKIEKLAGFLEGKTIACLGLTFKPGTDDMRDSPSLTILPALQAKGAKVKGIDVAGMEQAKDLLNIEFCDNIAQTIQGADVLIMMTEWPEYTSLNPSDLAAQMNDDAVVADLRRVWTKKQLLESGFKDAYIVGES
jgi:UDPglucose 6-dehydrogenase